MVAVTAMAAPKASPPHQGASSPGTRIAVATTMQVPMEPAIPSQDFLGLIDGAIRVIAFIATVVASDVGGYAVGVLAGKHPMAPSISPKKSWEGMAGSVGTCMVVATALLVPALDAPWWGRLVFGTSIAVTATIGDLGESLIKRDLGIKDMGALLPGHGGLMDRLDSLLPCAAVSWLLLAVLAPV